MKQDSKRMTTEDLSRMSVENLEYWVLHETHKDARQIDAKLLRFALERIAPASGVDEEREEVQQALLQFHWERDTQIHAYKSRYKRLRIITLIVLLLSMLTAIGFALGINIWKVAYDWAAEYLFMHLEPAVESIPGDEADDLQNPDDVADVWGNVYEVMQEYDVQVKLPAWKPERFELVDTEVSSIGGNLVAFSMTYLAPDETRLVLNIRRLEGIDSLAFLDAAFEADEQIQQDVVVGETVFHVMSNLSRTAVTWMEGPYSILITGDLELEEVESMLGAKLKPES